MLVVIDESGDPGFKPGSSSHFVVGMIVFDTFSDAQEAANMIAKLKKDGNYRREFHFNECDNRKRDAFFTAIRPAKFKVRLFIVEKRLIHSHFLKHNKEGFVNYCLKMMMKHDAGRLKDAHIKIDGTGSRIFKQASRKYLTQGVGAGCVKKLKFIDSKSDLLVQLADMVVSGYSRPFHRSDRKDAYQWRNMIDNKIENIWNFS